MLNIHVLQSEVGAWHVWESCGYPLRAGQSLWRPYEILDLAVQLQMLEATATAINMLETRAISPPGELAELFWQEPRTRFTNAVERKKDPVNYWQEAIKAINEALAEARRDPEIAHSLFNMASWGRRDPESLQKLRDMFAKDGIPPEFLSQYVLDGPFAYLRQNDGLSDKF
jgi:hypothetical protein